MIEIKRVTVYNPHENQTDSTPCLAGGLDICKLYGNGVRPLALSQDLCAWAGCGRPGHYAAGHIQKGTRVRVHHPDPFVSGEYYVADALNERYRNSIDIFHPTKSTGLWSGAKLEILGD